VDYVGKTKEKLKIENDKKTDHDFRQFLVDAFRCADMVMGPGAAFYIWHADLEGYNFRGACHDNEWNVRQCLIWNKNTLVMGRQDYQWKHEPCLYGWKEGAAHKWMSDRKQVTVLEFNRPSRSELHPTTKPVELFEYQMLNSTQPLDVVLDIFGGSGSTLLAAEKNNRKACVMEIGENYCDVIINRWQNFTGQKAKLESTGQLYDEIASIS
jgi:site-specific DNA-methyltransferase (adenine-specific)